MTTPQPPDSRPIYAIKDRQPEFPCWLYGSIGHNWRHFEEWKVAYTPSKGLWSHWSPDAPTAPTSSTSTGLPASCLNTGSSADPASVSSCDNNPYGTPLVVNSPYISTPGADKLREAVEDSIVIYNDLLAGVNRGDAPLTSVEQELRDRILAAVASVRDEEMTYLKSYVVPEKDKWGKYWHDLAQERVARIATLESELTEARRLLEECAKLECDEQEYPIVAELLTRIREFLKQP